MDVRQVKFIYGTFVFDLLESEANLLVQSAPQAEGRPENWLWDRGDEVLKRLEDQAHALKDPAAPFPKKRIS